MSPIKTIARFRRFIQANFTQNIPIRLRQQFKLGVNAFALTPVSSCNANSRKVHGGSYASAEQEMFRLLHNTRLMDLVWQTYAQLNQVKPSDVVNIDYSTIGSLAILGFAKQTRRGRAIPVFMESLPSNTGGQKKTHRKYLNNITAYTEWKETTGYDQYSFVMQALGKLFQLYGAKPRLALDRGFDVKSLIQFMHRDNWTFYVRSKSDHIVHLNGGECRQVRDLAAGSYLVKRAGCNLRLVVGQRKSGCKEPWYILTNDFSSSQQAIMQIYYHRFEIEECFRDLKSLFGVSKTPLRRWQSLGVVIVFMCIGIFCAMAYQTDKTTYPKEYTRHKKKRLSLVRIWVEAIERERFRVGGGLV
jgi:hypothetical protein